MKNKTAEQLSLEFQKDFIDLIKSELKRRKWTDKQFREELGGMAPSYWSEVKNLKKPPSMDLICRICILLGLTLDFRNVKK